MYQTNRYLIIFSLVTKLTTEIKKYTLYKLTKVGAFFFDPPDIYIYIYIYRERER